MGELFEIAGNKIKRGEKKEIKLKISEFYTAAPVQIPVTVIRGPETGPVFFVTASIHGDELNGTEMVRRIINLVTEQEVSGTCIFIPIVNLFGFYRSSRYFPDHRDLNRCFPGDPDGPPTFRVAHILFQEIISKCDYGIDIHTAGKGNWNLPHIRADLSSRAADKMARAFGARIIFNNKGNKGSLRYAAQKEGIAVIVFEAGETHRFENVAVREGVRGILNLLSELKMIQRDVIRSPRQQVVNRSSWIRTQYGGISQLLIEPGDRIQAGQTICQITSPSGKEVDKVKSPFDGLVIGVATDPSVSPGDAICHLVKMDEPGISRTKSRTGKNISEKVS